MSFRLAKRLLGSFIVALLILPTGAAVADHAGKNADNSAYWGHWFHYGVSGPGSTGGAYSAPPIDDRNGTIRNGVQLFTQAAATWRSSSAGLILPYTRTPLPNGGPFDCSPRDWTIVVCVADLGATQAAASTHMRFYDGVHILGAVVQINYNHRNASGGLEFSDQLLQRAVTHELGHALGLGHPACCPPTVMWGDISGSNPNAANGPNSHDTAALVQLYTYGH